jgi:Rrf2 family transcriptional regulator, iron-sulfur cluster assembly transcription factor
MLSNTSRYAIRALIYLAINGNFKNKIGIKKIADDLDIPSPFLGKILQTLAKQKILLSTKGPNGGFGLPESSLDISLMEIVKIIDGDDMFDQCLVSNQVCKEPAENPCALHEHYKSIRESIKSMFRERTIGGLAKEFRISGEKIDR